MNQSHFSQSKEHLEPGRSEFGCGNELGHGAEQDYVKAAKHYWNAIEQVNGVACLYLDRLYAMGLVIRKYTEVAYDLWSKAFKIFTKNSTDSYSLNYLGFIYYYGLKI